MDAVATNAVLGLSKLTALAPPAVLPTIAPALQTLAPVIGNLGLPPATLGLVPPPGIALPMSNPGVGMLAAPSIVTPVLSQPQEALRQAQVVVLSPSWSHALAPLSTTIFKFARYFFSFRNHLTWYTQVLIILKYDKHNCCSASNNLTQHVHPSQRINWVVLTALSLLVNSKKMVFRTKIYNLKKSTLSK